MCDAWDADSVAAAIVYVPCYSQPLFIHSTVATVFIQWLTAASKYTVAPATFESDNVERCVINSTTYAPSREFKKVHRRDLRCSFKWCDQAEEAGAHA